MIDVLLLLVMASATSREVQGPVREPGFEGFINVAALATTSAPELPGARVRVLSRDAGSGRRALHVSLPAGFGFDTRAVLPTLSLELLVLDGEITVGDRVLHQYDFVFVPADTPWPALRSGPGATLLAFLDPVTTDRDAAARQRERGAFITHYDAANWRAGIVAREAGIELKLEVQDLKRDPDTTARTWLLRAGPGLAVPWERHSVVEEGYVLDGDYRNAECLQSGTVIGNYRPGGYFRREPGIVHSGPDSGTKGGVLWLLRSPAALDVTFVEGCPPIAR